MFLLSVSDGVTLKLRGRFELNEMINHPLFTIVFLLEYMVNIPVSQPEVPTGRKAKNKVSFIYTYWFKKTTDKAIHK